ncbi:hypothetical protein VT06_05325 [Arsukibacterium sp. MJ3]|uniref:PEP-CTERM sorting domain-containing protein n=1 Tax=Arsukibacterium sp. MJ3 TaxID=1632859 RepID=UPI000627387B|nr:PEP-CTERM sorting domain-containing protein [Arsukibacterium sp. MJ3]KKO49620.1 hypothetical protein VT06_05325 [Arsukibacterium sp. MJ3]
MFKSVFFTLALLVSSALVLPQTAQAGLIITQQFQLEDGTIFGRLSIDIDDIDEFGFVENWQLFELFGTTMTENYLFSAQYNPLNLLAGLEFLSFDVSGIDNIFAYQGFWDKALNLGFFDIFSPRGGDPVDFFNIRLGAVSVSEPASWLLFLTAGFGLLLRRRLV